MTSVTGDPGVPGGPVVPGARGDVVDLADLGELSVEEGAARVIALLIAQRSTLAVAESLTGGLLLSTLIAVPGASAAVRGGVVAYASDLKTSLLGVDAELLSRRGAVDAEVARQMARGVRDRLGATYGVATTGVAGPDPQDGQPVGRVLLGWCAPAGREFSRDLDLAAEGGRNGVRRAAVAEAVTLILASLAV